MSANLNLDRLKMLRKERKISQEEIGEYLNISKVSYYKREKGITPILLHEAKKISEILNMSIEDIFFEHSVN